MAWTNSGRAFEGFDAQFEPNGDGFLYRRSLKGAPIRVSAAERDRFSAAYRRIFRRLIWGTAAAILALLAAVMAPAFMSNRDPPQILIFATMAVGLLPMLLIHHRLWNAPARELRGRSVVGRERSRSEASHVWLSRLSWAQFGATLLVVPVLLFKVSFAFDIWHGWGRLWLLFAGIIAMMLVYQAIRKWQISAGGD